MGQGLGRGPPRDRGPAPSSRMIQQRKAAGQPEGLEHSSMSAREEVALDENDVQRAEAFRLRKTTAVLAVLFTDIVRSTELLDEIGEVAYERIREEHHAAVRDLIEADDTGAIVKSTG